jgi:hypothetical protein
MSLFITVVLPLMQLRAGAGGFGRDPFMATDNAKERLLRKGSLELFFA